MNTKQCRVCLETKPFEKFERRSNSKDGRRNDCYCCRNRVKKTKPYYKEYRAKKARVRYKEDPAFRAKKREMFAENKRHFPEKQKAREYVKEAIQAGRLVRLPCPCGNPKSHGHHEDYSKPLEVAWLCASCHMKLHYQKGKAAISMDPNDY